MLTFPVTSMRLPKRSSRPEMETWIWSFLFMTLLGICIRISSRHISTEPGSQLWQWLDRMDFLMFPWPEMSSGLSPLFVSLLEFLPLLRLERHRLFWRSFSRSESGFVGPGLRSSRWSECQAIMPSLCLMVWPEFSAKVAWRCSERSLSRWEKEARFPSLISYRRDIQRQTSSSQEYWGLAPMHTLLMRVLILTILES